MAIEVGAAFISVRPDLRGFHNEIKNDLRRLAPQMLRIGREWGAELQKGIKEKLNPIRIRLDATQAAQRLVALNRSLDRLDGRRVEFQVRANFGAAFHDIVELQASLRRIDKQRVEVTIHVEMSGALTQLAALEQVLNRIDGRTLRINVNADRGVSSLLRLGSSAGSASGGLGLLSKKIKGIPLPALAAGALGAGTALIQLAANLAPAIGLAAAFPIVLSSAVAGLGTLLLALNGVGTAFGAALGEDAKKFQESLKGLAPAARQAALEMRAMRPALVGIQQAAQQALFKPLRGQITAVVKAIAGPLRAGVKSVAAEFGAAARSVTRFVASAKTVASVRDGFSGLRRAVALIRPALVPILTGFRDLSIAAVPSLLRMSSAVGDVGKRFGEWMSQLAASGRVPEIIGAGLDVLKAVGSLLADLGGIIKSVFTAAQQAGSGLFGILGPALDQLNAFLKTAAAQSALQAFFSTMSQIGRTLAPIIPILGHIITQLVTALYPVIQALLPIVSLLIRAFGQVVRAITPILAPLGQTIAALARGLLPILTPLVNMVAQTATELGGALVAALTAALPSIQQIVMAVASMLPALKPLIPLIPQLLMALLPLLPLLADLSATMVTALIPAMRLLNTIGASVIVVVFKAIIFVVRVLVGYIQILGAGLKLYFTAIGIVIRAVGAAATWLWTNAIGPAFRAIGAAAVWLWQTAILPAFRAIVAAGRWLFTVLAIVVIGPLVIAFRVISAVVLWLWRNVIVPAFHGIVAVIRLAWAIIKPIFTVIVAIIRGVLRVAFLVLWNVVKIVWIAIQIAIKVAWAVIKVIFNAIKSFISAVLAPAFRWLWRNVIIPVWNGIKRAIAVAWSGIKTAFNAIKSFLARILAPAFNTFKKVASIAWTGLKTTISNVTGVIKGIFNGLKSAVGKVKDAFRAAVNGIGVIWNRLKSITKAPVNFVIGLYNDGIVRLVDRIAGFAGVKTRLTRIPKFARGGVLPGYAPGVDSLLAAVSPGEAIMRPEFTRAVGSGFVVQANDVARKSGVEGVRRWLTGPDAIGGEGLAFARGGVVPGESLPGFAGQYAFGGIIGDFVKGVRDWTIGNVGKAASSLLGKILKSVPGSGIFRDVINAIPAWIKDTILKWIKDKVASGGPGARKALSFAQAQEGKPYVWGGVGPGGFDCSGFMSALTNVIQGKSPYSRRFTTFSFTGASNGPAGFRRNIRSPFSVGVTNAGVGHMAGTLLGHNVESSGSAGVRVDSGARGTGNGLFNLRYGLKFDEGGFLPPGVSTVLNGTGRPEPVLTNAQLEALVGGSSGGSVEYHAHFDGMTRSAYEHQVRAGIQAEAILAAQRDRTGRRR